VAALVGVALAAAYFTWFRTSSFVAVTKVEVTGLSSPEAPRITEAVTKAAGEMSTLAVDAERLEKAVAGFPTVIGLTTDSDFPHGLTVAIRERPPVLIAKAKDGSVPVGPDGVLLRGLDLGDAASGFPVLEVKELPASGKLAGADLSQAVVVGAAPAPLRPLIEGVSIEGERGVEVTMRGGVPIRFGTPELAEEKWAAASAVLADPKTETLTYVDVRVPERPALGGAQVPAADDAVEEEIAPAEAAVVPEDPAAAVPTDPAAVVPAPVEPGA
jgi:cell division protein FtsQ